MQVLVPLLPGWPGDKLLAVHLLLLGCGAVSSSKVRVAGGGQELRV